MLHSVYDRVTGSRAPVCRGCERPAWQEMQGCCSDTAPSSSSAWVGAQDCFSTCGPHCILACTSASSAPAAGRACPCSKDVLSSGASRQDAVSKQHSASGSWTAGAHLIGHPPCRQPPLACGQQHRQLLPRHHRRRRLDAAPALLSPPAGHPASLQAPAARSAQLRARP